MATQISETPPEWISTLIELNDTDKIMEIIDTQFPNWIKHISTAYHTKYNYLNRNWNEICKNLKCERQKILLVSHIPNKDDKDQQKASEMSFICDFLTQRGFVIRRDIEFLKCKNSDNVYPCKELYKIMKKNELQVPHAWEKL